MNRLLHALSIPRKLTLVMSLTSCATLIAVCIAWLGFDWSSHREDQVREVRLMCQMLGQTARPALSSGGDLHDALFALREHEGIRRAVIHDAAGDVLTRYQIDDHAPLSSADLGPEEHGHRLTDGSLLVWTSILDGDGALLARVGVESDLSMLRSRQLEILGIVALVLGLCLALNILGVGDAFAGVLAVAGARAAAGEGGQGERGEGEGLVGGAHLDPPGERPRGRCRARGAGVHQ